MKVIEPNMLEAISGGKISMAGRPKRPERPKRPDRGRGKRTKVEVFHL